MGADVGKMRPTFLFPLQTDILAAIGKIASVSASYTARSLSKQ